MPTSLEPTVVRVRHAPDGRPAGAAAQALIDRPVARVWSIIADVERYAGRVPMIHRVKRDGDRVTVDLKFKVAFLSVGFTFVADATYEKERWLELRWVSGEPRGIRLRFELEPSADGNQTILRSDGEFDPYSLGFLAKYFLKHLPEIEYGIFPGVALALIDSMRKASLAA